jgi:hypothetical protein
MLLTVLCAMVGAVGTGVAVSRARSNGTLARLRVVPRPAHRAIGGWVAAAASVDLLQLLPALLVVVIGSGAAADAALVLVLAVAAVLLLANSLGCIVALAAGSAGEVLLDVAVVLAPLLYLGGLFTGVPSSGWRHWVAAVDPFAGLHSAFIAALGGSPSLGEGQVVVLALAWLGASLIALRALGGALLERA